MSTQDIAAALRRATSVFERRPAAGLDDDSPATASWQGGLRVVTSHANGTALSTDMPVELGGTGDRISPGWPFRAGLAACATTSIAMVAVAEGVELAHLEERELDALEVRVASRSDARAMLGMSEADGSRVDAVPSDMQLQVRIAAPGVPAERLRAVVDEGYRRSPCPAAVIRAVPIALSIDAVEAVGA